MGQEPQGPEPVVDADHDHPVAGRQEIASGAAVVLDTLAEGVAAAVYPEKHRRFFKQGVGPINVDDQAVFLARGKPEHLLRTGDHPVRFQRRGPGLGRCRRPEPPVTDRWGGERNPQELGETFAAGAPHRTVGRFDRQVVAGGIPVAVEVGIAVGIRIAIDVSVRVAVGVRVFVRIFVKIGVAVGGRLLIASFRGSDDDELDEGEPGWSDHGLIIPGTAKRP